MNYALIDLYRLVYYLLVTKLLWNEGNEYERGKASHMDKLNLYIPQLD